VLDWFGPTDFVAMVNGKDDDGSPLARLIGGPVLANKDKALKVSPMTYVTKDAAPFLIMHGDQDKLVPLSQSEMFTQALKKAGVEVKLQVIPGNGHGGPGFNTAESNKLMKDFFDKHLRPAK
jgi:dipeptidyl aminopeptidase/acylaminoacyl peptidase